MRLSSAVALGIMLQLTSGAAFGQEAGKEPKFRPTSPQLERRDQPVAGEDLEKLVRADEILADDIETVLTVAQERVSVRLAASEN